MKVTSKLSLSRRIFPCVYSTSVTRPVNVLRPSGFPDPSLRISVTGTIGHPIALVPTKQSYSLAVLTPCCRANNCIYRAWRGSSRIRLPQNKGKQKQQIVLFVTILHIGRKDMLSLCGIEIAAPAIEFKPCFDICILVSIIRVYKVVPQTLFRK